MSPYNPLSNNRPVLAIGAAIGVLILAYALFVASPYLQGPYLTLTSPLPGSTVSSSTVTVSGVTKRVSYLTIDDMAVPLAEDGSFKIVRAYPAGYTVVVVRARDRFGRENVETVRFVHVIP
jgi:hypothetical protein